MNKHKEEMENLLKKLQAAEKVNDDGNCVDNCDSDNEFGTTITQAQEYFSKCDEIFNELHDKICEKLRQSEYVENSTPSVDCTVEMPNIKLNDVTDHLGRTLLHAACENGNYNLAWFLLQAGSNPNAKETCGVTPLGIAIIQKNKPLCELLLDYHACAPGPLFVNIPSPLELAEKMELTDIYNTLNRTQSDSDNDDDDIAQYGTSFKRIGSSANNYNVKDSCSQTNINRQTPGFLTGIIGDQGTCKTIRGVMARTSVHEWIGLVPGDMHTKGYFCEACFKEQGPGGFHYIVNNIMKRPKLTRDAFKKKNLTQEIYFG